MPMKRIFLSLAVSGLALTSPGMVTAEEGQDAQRQQGTSEGFNEIVSDHPPVTEELKRLQQLKRENPEAFQQSIEERKARLRERMAHLKARDPTAYANIQRQIQQRRQERLERLKERHPTRFEELMVQRHAQAQAQLERLKQQHPEQYEDLMKRRQAWRQHQLEPLKRNPDTLERFKANHPNWVQPPQPLRRQQQNIRSEHVPTRGIRNGSGQQGDKSKAP